MAWQNAMMSALRERAERLPPGWKMYTGVVGGEHLPEGFASGIREEFDAVAVGPDGGIIFEVVQQKSANSQAKIARIERIRKRLHRLSGWGVEVIVVPQASRLAQGGEIENRLQAVSELVESGESSGNREFLRAAFVLAFSVLEWTLARHFKDVPEGRPLNVRQMAEKMVSEGILSEDVYREIRELQAVRSEIVHGLSVTATIDGDTVRHIMQVAETVNAELSRVQT
ncbi:hypothetical protein [Streptomyces coelicoflavus]|uniref:REase AHJR-like domain-containing protein n=1 Tax=Streptomyces coelicoflavus TaxID=285562 RepID=A0A6N9UH99_9ACTN|nr:hypothetical protein [Streptomyces coelicoflavus]NEB15600.1 hypothetical protein [Streptomyces coelicoflavus]